MNGSKIAFHVEGATDEEIRRGLAAAQKVLDDAGVTAYTAATARFMRDGLDDAHVLAWQDDIIRFREAGREDEAVASEAELAGYMAEIKIDVMTEAQWAISHLWDEADAAAVEACCAGWPEVPETAGLKLLASAEAEREALAAADFELLMPEREYARA